MATAAEADDNSKREKVAARISLMLMQLFQGKALDKHEMAAEFQVGVRTIERDLASLSRHVERTTEGKWRLKQAASNNLSPDLIAQYARMVGTDKLYPDRSVNYLIEQTKRGDAERTTRVKAAPVVDVRKTSAVFEGLERACQQHQVCTFTHSAKARRVNPYALIHNGGVWYLAAEDGEKLKMFSLERISGLTVLADERFKPKKAHQEYIQQQDDVWFTGETVKVMLRVSAEVAHYFERRDLLPEQQNRRDPDGSLLVNTKINHPHQLLPVVRYWMPHVRIIEPKAWHADLVSGLKATLDKWGES